MDEVEFTPGYLSVPLQAFIMRIEAPDGTPVRCKITFALLRERLNNPDATQDDLRRATRRDRKAFEAACRNMINGKWGEPDTLEPCTDPLAEEEWQVVLSPEAFERFRDD